MSMCYLLFFFFFSSRRRHTRLVSDWSSDVCSSDLVSLHEQELVCEIVGGEPYEYYPLGQYVVRAPGVCGGRPTFKYTRIDVRSEERRVGKECRYRLSTDHEKKKGECA